MPPFTQDQFLAVFAAYNEAIWPAQIAAYVVGVAVVALSVGHPGLASRSVPSLLGVLWIWTGAAYHWLFFSPINPAALMFGAAFVLQGLLLLAFGLRGRVGFATDNPARRWTGLGLIVYAMLLYPLLGLAAGHVYPASPSFGITPCPLTIFTFGVLLLASRASWLLMVVPVLWAFVGGSAAVLLGVPEDWMLPISAVAAVVLMMREARPRAPHAPLPR